MMLHVIFGILYYIFGTVIVFYIFLDITWRLWKRKLSFLPSAPNVPWLGSVPFWKGDSHDVYKMRMTEALKYDHLYVTWFGFTPVIKIGCVEYIEPLLRSQEALTKTIGYNILREWLGEGLLTSTNAKWKKRRISLTGAFHFAILNDFVDIYEKHAQNLVDKLQIFTKKDNLIEVQWIISLSLLDVICETSMGVCVDALNSSDSEYVRAVRDVKTLLLKRFSNPFLVMKTFYQHTAAGRRYYKCLDILHNFTRKVINENIASRSKQPKGKGNVTDEKDFELYRRKKQVFIDVLLDLYENGEIDVAGIQEEVDTFMFEGHDTTSSSLSWTLYEIGRHPVIQEQLHSEIDSISSKDCSLVEKIRMMKYMECVIKESLRLHPPVPGFARELKKEMIIGNNIIPPGTLMNVDCFSVHRNPLYWDEPTIFNPDRFKSDNSSKRNPFTYIPFSAGPRNCIGQKFAMIEEKVFLYMILSNFRISSTQSPDEVQVGVDLITYSVNGINIRFSTR